MSSRAHRVEGAAAERYDWGVGQARLTATLAPLRAATPAKPETADDQARAVAVERDAFSQGYAQGERAGAEVAAKRGEGMLRRLAETLQELTALRAEIIRRSERQTVQLALAISKRIIEREISLDRSLLVAMARVALDRLGEQASATIRLHPDDFAAVSGGQPIAADDQYVRIVADSVVSRGGCLVQSDFGFMDVGVDAQFGEIVKALLGDIDGQPAHVTADTHAHVSVARD